MDLQPTARATLLFILGFLTVGCAGAGTSSKPAYQLIAVGPEESSVRMYRSAHHLLYTTLDDPWRVESSIATLEAAYDKCVEITGVRPPADSTPQNAFLFKLRSEWEAFTRSRAGAAAPIYLRLDRGGYTLGRACVVRDQGEHDTLVVLAHEQMHLFIANHFEARPPPFLEEGLATLLERVDVSQDRVAIEVGRSGGRALRLGAVIKAGELMPLRQLLSMHAGNVVGLGGPEVDAFYSQAWAFARFLREADGGKYRPAFVRLIDDSATGRLASSLADDPALVERYLGQKLEAIQPEYERFASKLASRE